MLRRSNKSAVWKISSSGTPYFLIAAWNLKRMHENLTQSLMKSFTFERFPSIGSWFRVLGSSWCIPEWACWPTCRERFHLSRCLRSYPMEQAPPILHKSRRALLALVPYYVAVNRRTSQLMWSHRNVRNRNLNDPIIPQGGEKNMRMSFKSFGQKYKNTEQFPKINLRKTFPRLWSQKVWRKRDLELCFVFSFASPVALIVWKVNGRVSRKSGKSVGNV